MRILQAGVINIYRDDRESIGENKSIGDLIPSRPHTQVMESEDDDTSV